MANQQKCTQKIGERTNDRSRTALIAIETHNKSHNSVENFTEISLSIHALFRVK